MPRIKKLNQNQGFKAGAEPQFIPSLPMGPWASYSYLHDPRHLSFLLSRYKFCAKMLEGKARVLEIGCGDGFATPIVGQAVGRLLAVDSSRRLISGNRRRLKRFKNVEFKLLNICEEIPRERFDAVFSLDVIEHLDPHLEKFFFKHQCACLKRDGICILGTPNAAAFKHAKDLNKYQHINNKTHQSLRRLMETHFKNVFMFSMNDEMVHTGFGPMAHYLIALGVGPKTINLM